jgi:hypothetical protein
MQILLWTWGQIWPLFGGSKYLVHCLILCFYLMDLKFMFSTRHQEFRDSILTILISWSSFMVLIFMILISWFWYSWFRFHGLCWWSWCSCFQFSMLIVHNLIFTISIWWSWLMVLMLMISISLFWLNFFYFHMFYSQCQKFIVSITFFSIQWSRLMVWFSCCQLLMLIGHGFDPYDFNFIVLVDGHDVHAFNF